MGSPLKLKFIDLGYDSGPIGIGVDAALGYGASFALGQVHHRYGDKWYGRHASRIAAVVGKAGALAIQVVVGGGTNMASAVANTIGQAGINAMGLEHGLRTARTATGTKLVRVKADAALPAGATEVTSVGALPQAAPGRGLSWDQIEELASAH